MSEFKLFDFLLWIELDFHMLNMLPIEAHLNFIRILDAKRIVSSLPPDVASMRSNGLASEIQIVLYSIAK